MHLKSKQYSFLRLQAVKQNSEQSKGPSHQNFAKLAENSSELLWSGFGSCVPRFGWVEINRFVEKLF